MSLTMIIDSDTVIQRMSLQNLQEVKDAIDSTLTAAHAVIQGILQTTFEKTTRSDLFFLRSDYFPINPNGMMCCRLTQAFVWPESVSVVSNVNSRKDLINSPTAVSSLDYVVDAVRGLVKVDEAYADQWIKVTYTAGFDSTHKAPSWLQEAVLAFIPHLIVQPSGSMDASAMNAAREAAKSDFEVTAKIAEPYLRSSSFQFSPV